MLRRLLGRWHRVKAGETLAEIDPEFFRHMLVEIRLSVDPRPGALPGRMVILQMDCRQLEVSARYGYGAARGEWTEMFRTVEGLVLESRIKT